ncbi:unnamed protein product [Musa banksii]
MAAIGSDGRVASKRVTMLVALLLGSCRVGHGSGDEAHVGCIESERRALLTIKSDMHGPDDRFSSWTGEDCCGWRGVACDDATGHVTKLDLRYRYAYSMEDEYYTLKTMGGSKVNPSLQRLKHQVFGSEHDIFAGAFGISQPISCHVRWTNSSSTEY